MKLGRNSISARCLFKLLLDLDNNELVRFLGMAITIIVITICLLVDSFMLDGKWLDKKTYMQLAIYVFLFVIITLIAIWKRFLRARTIFSLCQSGEKTKGKLVRGSHRASKNDYYVEYFTDKKKSKSYKRRIIYSAEKANQKTTFLVLYNSKKPEKSVVLEVLPECLKAWHAHLSSYSKSPK